MFKNDMQLYNEAQQGNMIAYEVLFRRYYAPLCLYAHRFTGNPDYSEELVQDLFYVLWRDRAHLKIVRSVKSYLYEAIRNKALHYLQHLRVRERYAQEVKMEAAAGMCATSPEDDLEAREFEQKINSILLRFPSRRRRIFYMNRFGGDTYAEIAAKMSISVKTVESEMHKSLKALKSVVGEQKLDK